MLLFYDQMNNAVTIPHQPRRIVSLVPSQTEFLFDLGLNDRIVGVTKFCIHPAEKVKNITKIGGTKQLDISAIHNLQPDLIIANKEENEQNQINELMRYYPVWISDIKDLATALDMIIKLGEITGKLNEAHQIATVIEKRFTDLKSAINHISVAYLIWRKPYMAAGQDTFINSMLKLCGFQNVIKINRYPELTIEQLKAANPQVLLLSSEPYPFTQKHIDEFAARLPDAKILAVDGELFSWYGSSLLQSPAYFQKLIDKLTAM